MGCFSFLCRVCGKGIKSTSFHGEQCRLSLLKDGVVIQEMKGEYDSYGTVFIDGTQHEEIKHSLRKSEEWNDPTPEIPPKNDHDVWHRIVSLMHSEDNANGISAVHSKCDKGYVPYERSESDPNQGWGDDEELLEETGKIPE